jgi:DNA mismatch repair ATPase MutS
MLAAFAMTKGTCFPVLGSADGLQIRDLYHPGVKRSRRIYNSVDLGSADRRRHVLLTGPNRGGKSTLLKSLGCAVLMAQTVGIVFGRSATLPIFDNIITALSPQDVVGKLSLFEAEIEFAKDVKQRLATTPGNTFLMMDEIFHGTNAHDGVEASQVFLDDLYSNKTTAGLYSVVSTHYMDLPSRYGDKWTQNLCMEASVDPNDPDRLVYTYRVCDGVNRFSSVREILRERGLLTGRVKSDEKTTEAASKA